MVVVLLALSSGLAAQQGGGKWLRKADQFFREKEYGKAIEYYEWAARNDKSHLPLLGLGKTHRALKDYAKAESYFKQAAQHDDAPAETYFFLGQCMQSQDKGDSAKYWFAKFAELAPEDPRAASIGQFDTVQNQPVMDSSEVIVRSWEHNSKFSDFSPYPSGDDLYFCSSRPNQTAIVHTSSSDGGALVDLYVVKGYFDQTKRRKTAKPLADLNTRFHEGPLCFSADGKTIYFTRNDPARKQDNPYSGTLNPLRIFRADSTDKGWGAPVGLPINSPDYAIGHPALSPDGKKLYFASDKPGGHGGSDIYSMEITATGFGPVQNLGPSVNTPEDEVFPFVHAQGDLYFASNGHMGYGGLDLFRVSPLGTGWSDAQNLGRPMNSPQDDFGYYLAPSSKQGFFASNRGKRPSDDDIYTFKMGRPKFECVPQLENSYCYRFSEKGSMDLASDTDTIAMAYIWDMGDGTKYRGLTVDHCFEGPGEYFVQLNLVDTLSGFNFLTETSYVLRIEDEKQLYIDVPEAIYAGEVVAMDARKSNHPLCKGGVFYWEIDGVPKGKGLEYRTVFNKPGTYTVKLGAEGKSLASEGPCKACVTREVEVLPKR